MFALLLALGCDRGTPVPVAHEAERDTSRVVSLTPLATRFAIAIGARSRLVAVDAVSARLSATAGLPVSDLPGAVTLEPDLVLVVAERPASRAAQQAVRNALPASAEVAFFPFDPTFWVDASVEPARRLRAVIEPLSRRR